MTAVDETDTAGRLTTRRMIAAVVDNPVFVRTVAIPVSVYLIGQMFVVSVLGIFTLATGQSLGNRLTAWDGLHFLHIAEYGYSWAGPAAAPGSPAFLPGYPTFFGAIHQLTGLPAAAAALLLSWLCGAVAACAVYRLAGHIPGMGESAQLLAVGLFAVSPMSVVLGMAYSEALFCALAGWALAFALEQRWLVAGFLAGTAGLVRISAVALAVAFGVAAIVAVARRDADRGRIIAAAVMAGTGALSWIVYTGFAAGSPTAWFDIQRAGWNSQFDFGASVVRLFYRALTASPTVMLGVAVILVIAAVLVVRAIQQRQPLILLVYTVAAFVQVVGSSGVMSSKVRFLVPIFTLLLPVAAWLAAQPSRRTRGLFAAIAVAGAVFSAVSLGVWSHAI